MRKIFFIILFLLFSYKVYAEALDVVINEIGWSGTKASSSDEWIELYNNTEKDINLDGWKIYKKDGSVLLMELKGEIPAQGYYLIERTDDSTISDIKADLASPFKGGGLSNKGEHLILKDKDDNIIDELDFSSGWPKGSGAPEYLSMERIDPKKPGSLKENWTSNNKIIKNGKDKDRNEINGTPKSKNSATFSSKDKNQEEENQEEQVKPKFQNSRSHNTPPEVIYPKSISIFVEDKIPLDSIKIKDKENDNLSYYWNFGDGFISYKNLPTHYYKYPGEYIIYLEVNDGINKEDATIVVKVFPKNLYINEVFPNPGGKDYSNEWIELYNDNEFPVDLSGYIIKTSNDKYIFKNGTIIAPKSFLVLDSEYTKLNFKNKNETIYFIFPDGTIFQQIEYENAQENFSIARKNGKYFWSEVKTPSSKNIIFIKNNASENNSKNKVGYLKEENIHLSYDSNKITYPKRSSLYINKKSKDEFFVFYPTEKDFDIFEVKKVFAKDNSQFNENLKFKSANLSFILKDISQKIFILIFIIALSYFITNLIFKKRL